MTLAELNHEERLALVALLKLVARADKTLSYAESVQLRRVAQAMGDELFHATVTEAQEKFKSVTDAKQVALQVTRPAVRALIYRELVAIAEPGTIVAAERDVLSWLAREWDIDIDAETLQPS